MTAPVIDGLGTAEQTWQAWPGLASLPSYPLASVPPGRVVVVAPHPDDEVLGVGGILALLAAAGRAVEVVAVTDGEASHPASTVLTPAQLAGRRRAETATALRCLGVEATVTRLGVGDGRVAAAQDEVAAALTERLAGAGWCLATWSGDGHPDHEAVGRAAVTAAASTGVALAGYPVWAWHWAVPGDGRVPWCQGRRVCLPESVRTRKRAAVAAFATQVRALGAAPGDAPVLPAHVLARFDRDFETLLLP